MIVGISITTRTARSDKALIDMLEALLEIVAAENHLFFEANPETPCCLDCGDIKYREPGFSDRIIFASAQDIIRTSQAGCAGAAAYMAGRGRFNGRHDTVVLQHIGPRDFHAVVRYPDGSTFDPTLDMPV